MSFDALSTGGAAALLALAAAAVALLYRLHPPPRRLAVSSLLLWRAARTRPSRRERLRWWLSLLLATGIGLALALAALGARLAGAGSPLLLVVDTAPGMSARGSDGTTRLQRAVTRGEVVLEGLGGATRVRVADTCGESGARGSRDAARRALRRLQPCPDAVVHLPPPFPDERVVLVSDGVAALPALPEGATRLSVFEPVVNAGITAFAVEETTGGGVATAELVNASLARRRVRFELSSGEWRHAEELELGPGEAVSLVRTLPSGLAGLVEAQVGTAGDAFAEDDRALAWLGAARWRVALLGEPDPHLEMALRLDPRIALVADIVNADVAIASGVEPPEGRASLWLPATPPPAPQPRRLDSWVAGHPLLRDVPLADVTLTPAAGFDRGDGEVLASAGDAPALVARRVPVRALRLGFALESSSWPRQPGFPVFLGNTLEWLAGPAALHVRPGVVRVPLPRAEIHAPDGSRVAARPEAGETRFRALGTGAYLARTGGRDLPILVSRVDRRVTLLNRSTSGDSEPGTPLPDAVWIPELPPLLLLVAALLLGGEWWSWRRRLTV